MRSAVSIMFFVKAVTAATDKAAPSLLVTADLKLDPNFSPTL
jgi:hypothetical protein